jgi:hypothetical protein
MFRDSEIEAERAHLGRAKGRLDRAKGREVNERDHEELLRRITWCEWKYCKVKHDTPVDDQLLTDICSFLCETKVLLGYDITDESVGQSSYRIATFSEREDAQYIAELQAYCDTLEYADINIFQKITREIVDAYMEKIK